MLFKTLLQCGQPLQLDVITVTRKINRARMWEDRVGLISNSTNRINRYWAAAAASPVNSSTSPITSDLFLPSVSLLDDAL